MSTSETPSPTGPTEPAEENASPEAAPPTPPTPAAAPEPKEPRDLRILKNLQEGLTRAIELYEEGGARKIFAVVSADEDVRPTVHSFDTVKELIAFLLPLRGTEAAVFLFYGAQWFLRPGHVWQIYDGKQFIPMVLEPEEVEQDLLLDGRMAVAARDPREVVPSQAEPAAGQAGEQTGEPAAGNEGGDQQAPLSPTQDALFGLRTVHDQGDEDDAIDPDDAPL